MCTIVFSACTQSNDPEFIAVNPGGHEGPLKTSGPPMDPESWHVVPGDIMGVDEVWGNRINPKNTFMLPGGIMGLVYGSAPPLEWREDPKWREQQMEQGLVIGETGSFAFTRDLVNWYDFPGNPVLNEQQQPWQTHRRVLMGGDIIFDPDNSRWVAFFGNMILSREEAGIRSVGVAYSKDLVNWEYADGPVLTIEDYAAFVPERIEATREELHEHGRIYAGWALYHGGQYYLTLSGTERVGPVDTDERQGISDIHRGRVLLASDSPEGPFELVAEVDENQLPPGSKPVYWNGKWYTVFSGNWDGQPGYGLAWADHIFGPYTKNPQNPIITVESTQRTSPMLYHFDGTWGVLFSRSGNWWEDLPLRMAIANFHPALLMAGKNSSENSPSSLKLLP